ncbi:MAG: exodeoxyribonuclease VII large subunit, partial [Deltaproteobacteria bacterium]|nr:exodeoxyribonuclease VII large subunit [Deltaproteobacteria bacterium]
MSDPRLDEPTSATPAILTVTQLNQRARLLIERTFARVSVVGELSGLRQVSGHFYFTLKDEGAQLNAVLFRGDARFIKTLPTDGMEVVATGRLTVYPPQGRYQLVVERLEARGAGALQIAFEKLKEKLAAEGLFAAARKRALPVLPRRVAVITSPTGSVIRDIVQVATRRLPGAHIIVFPARVQGADAAPEIAAAIGRASRAATAWAIDVIIVARGGGSLEDL